MLFYWMLFGTTPVVTLGQIYKQYMHIANIGHGCFLCFSVVTAMQSTYVIWGTTLTGNIKDVMHLYTCTTNGDQMYVGINNTIPSNTSDITGVSMGVNARRLYTIKEVIRL